MSYRRGASSPAFRSIVRRHASLLGHLHAHRAGGARDDLGRLVDVVGIQVGHLLLGDLAHLGLADRADLVAVRLARALLEPDRLLDQDGRRRGLRDEGEGAVLEDRDLHRDDRAVLALGLGVEGLAELHDVHAVLAQGGADRRGRVGGAARNLELDEGEDLPGHQTFLTWSNPTSTGVSRPKIDTSTLSLAASSLISEISPEKSDSGPDTTFTDSPIENWALVRGRSAASRCIRRSISVCESGTGFCWAPTKPVTPGVPLTSVHESSFKSMFTST